MPLSPAAAPAPLVADADLLPSAGADTTGGAGDEFDLDVRFVDSVPVIAELMRSTSDNCGGTCSSACVSCRS